MNQDTIALIEKCKELFELLSQRNPNSTRCHVLLLELRELSDKKDMVIPIQAFEAMGPELRMGCFDMFLGLLAATLNIVLPEKTS